MEKIDLYSRISLNLEPCLSTFFVSSTQITFTKTSQLNWQPSFSITLQNQMANPTISIHFTQMHFHLHNPTFQVHLWHTNWPSRRVPLRVWDTFNLQRRVPWLVVGVAGEWHVTAPSSRMSIKAGTFTACDNMGTL